LRFWGKARELRTKPAKFETGLEIRVPGFIAQGKPNLEANNNWIRPSKKNKYLKP